MKLVIRSLYNEPVVFLAVLQAVVLAAVAEQVAPLWAGVVVLAAITILQRHFVRPNKPLAIDRGGPEGHARP